MKGLFTDLSLALVSFPDVRAKEFQSTGSIENYEDRNKKCLSKDWYQNYQRTVSLSFTCPYYGKGVSVLISLDYTLVILHRTPMFQNFFPCGSL